MTFNLWELQPLRGAQKCSDGGQFGPFPRYVRTKEADKTSGADFTIPSWAKSVSVNRPESGRKRVEGTDYRPNCKQPVRQRGGTQEIACEDDRK